MPVRKHSAGLALITVLWLVSLLTILAAVVLASTRTHGRAANRMAEIIEAETRADSAIKLKLMEIGIPRSSGAGLAREPSISEVSGVARSVERESARIDLNTASADLLLAMFASNGYSENEARSLAARVVDWRDSDSAPEVQGAEVHEYVAAGMRYVPRNAPFETVEELRRVLGLFSASDSIVNGFTVYTHAPSAIPSTSIPSVLSALQFADARQLGGRRWLDRTSIGHGGEEGFIGEVVRIRSCVNDGVRVCRVVVVRLTGSQANPFQIFIWRTDFQS